MDILSEYYIYTMITADMTCISTKAPVPLCRICFPNVHDIHESCNREQSETNRNDGNEMCDYLSECLQMCFRLFEYSSGPFLNILRTLCEQIKTNED